MLGFEIDRSSKIILPKELDKDAKEFARQKPGQVTHGLSVAPGVLDLHYANGFYHSTSLILIFIMYGDAPRHVRLNPFEEPLVVPKLTALCHIFN
ncbi:MAG: hypothetical protein ABL999_09245 [Pyrinomonadaceae bacterium]